MTNSSSLFKNNQTLFFLAALMAVSLYGVFAGDYLLAGLVAAAAAIGLFIPASGAYAQGNPELQKDVRRVLRAAAQGDLEQRITHIHSPNPEQENVAWAVNDVLDQLEAFMRDAETTIRYASEGKTYRRTYPSGMHGIFRTTAEELNEAISAIAQVRQSNPNNDGATMKNEHSTNTHNTNSP